MTKKFFSSDHEYVIADGGSAAIGISDYAQDQLGDIVFVELPEVGASFKKGDEFAVVESVKAASEIYAPVDFTITAVNEALSESPDQVNSDAMGKGWLIKVTLDNTEQLNDLMDESAYATHIA